MVKFMRYILILFICLLGFSFEGNCQFKDDVYQRNSSTDTTSVTDTSAKLIDFKEIFGGLAHKRTMRIGTMFGTSIILPGASQIYNKQYWKLPIVYGGIAAFAASGGYYMHQYTKSKKAYDNFNEIKLNYETRFGIPYNVPAPEINYRAKTTGTWLLVGAGLVYWGSLLDGAISYKSDKNPDPGKATIYSILLPGLGQIYNGEWFKVPIYWGCILGGIHFWTTNSTNYERFRGIYKEATSPNYTGPISADTAKWYRDEYRRYRDYSILATCLFYLLQVIDANVFAYMQDFDVSDDISLGIQPTVIAPDNQYAIHTASSPTAFGLKFGLTF